MINANLQNDFTKSTNLYYQDLKNINPISDKYKEIDLIKKAQNGDKDARQVVIKSNLKFVFQVAKKYKGRGIPINDLISEGNIGLMIAIDKFNTDKNIKFITYAIFWIKERIINAIEENSNKKYLEHSFETYVSNKRRKDTNIHNDCTNDDEIVDSLEILFSSLNESSYDVRLNEIENFMSVLNDKEKIIISSVFGFNGKPTSYKSLTTKLHLSAERIRQIKNSGIRKMRRYALLHYSESDFF